MFSRRICRTSCCPSAAGNSVPCYDLELTICDVIRSRNKIGTETFLSALKQYAASPKKDLNRLDDYARQMWVSGVLRQYLDVLKTLGEAWAVTLQ